MYVFLVPVASPPRTDGSGAGNPETSFPWRGSPLRHDAFHREVEPDGGSGHAIDIDEFIDEMRVDADPATM